MMGPAVFQSAIDARGRSPDQNHTNTDTVRVISFVLDSRSGFREDETQISW